MAPPDRVRPKFGIGYGIGQKYQYRYQYWCWSRNFFAENNTFFQILLIFFLLLGGIQVFISLKINLAHQK